MLHMALSLYFGLRCLPGNSHLHTTHTRNTAPL